MEKIKVIIADDSDFVRSGMKIILDVDDEFDVIGCAANGREAIELAETAAPIFDTEKLLNRPATVEISKTSGLAGLAYWVNQNFRLTGTDLEVHKNDPLIIQLKAWVDAQYEDGRQTMISHKELEEQIHSIAPHRFT